MFSPKLFSWLGLLGAIAATVAGQAEVVGQSVANGATLLAAIIGTVFGQSLVRSKDGRRTDP